MKSYYGHMVWVLLGLLSGCAAQSKQPTLSAEQLNQAEVIRLADAYLAEKVITITAFRAERSAGGRHDYFSEGLYWWPDPENPDGPYVRRDGLRNPDNFNAHKKALKDMAEWVTTLTAAYQLTDDDQYAQAAIRHLKAWFSDPATRMIPSLLYAQAIKGINTGRGIGIIDTICLIDVALSIRLLAAAGVLKAEDYEPIKDWFAAYGDWLTTHAYGIDERDNNNNHSTWWGAQVAAFARVADRKDLLIISQEQFKKQLNLQMAADGSFPGELHRTKPFHYTNYNLRGWTTFCQLASSPDENLWAYESKNGLLQKAVDFVMPYLQNPTTWPHHTELETVIHPHRNDYLYFAAQGLENDEYLDLWQQLEAQEYNHHANLVLWQKLEQL